MNNYRLIINGIELAIFGGLSWSDDDDGLSTLLQFTSLINLSVGNQFTLLNSNNIIMNGIITDKSYDKYLIYQYTCADLGFYLNKNSVVIQFNGILAKQAITQLLNKYNLPVGNIPDVPVMIKNIYKNVILSDVLKDIIYNMQKKTGNFYNIRVNNGLVNIVQSEEIDVTAYYDNSGFLINLTDAVSNFEAVDSIQDMKNSVLVVSSGNKILAQAQDNNSIATFGLLQHIEEPDQDKNTSNYNIANNLLKDLNQIKQTKSVDMLGTDAVMSGVVLNFNYPELNFVAKYYVKHVDHTIDGVIHKIKCDLEVYDD